MGLERGPLSVVSAIEELFERKSSGSGLENQEYGRRDPSRWPRGCLYPQELALTSPASGCRSVGIARSRTKATELKIIDNGIWGDCAFLVCTWRRNEVTVDVYFRTLLRANRIHPCMLSSGARPSAAEGRKGARVEGLLLWTGLRDVFPVSAPQCMCNKKGSVIVFGWVRFLSQL
jgi:hypothetical protein